MYNGHGDVTALIDSSGNILATDYYDSFGNILSSTGTFDNPFKYAGYYYDSETEDYYLIARYYDPVTARFLSEDTYRGSADDSLSLNLYTYCHNEPLMYTDPTGHIMDGIYKDASGYYTLVVDGKASYPKITTDNIHYDYYADLYNEQYNSTGAYYTSYIEEGSSHFAVTYYEGETRYTNDNGRIYKDSKLVSSVSYKYIPTQVGGTRKDTNNVKDNDRESESGNLSMPGFGLVTLTPAQQSSVTKLNNIINNNLTPSDFSGTEADLRGNPIPNGKGGYYDHLTEMKQSLTGLKDIKESLEGSLKNPNLDMQSRQLLQKSLDKTNYYIDKIETLFNKYKDGGSGGTGSGSASSDNSNGSATSTQPTNDDSIKIKPGTYMDEIGNIWVVDKNGNKTLFAKYENGTYTFPFLDGTYFTPIDPLIPSVPMEIPALAY